MKFQRTRLNNKQALTYRVCWVWTKAFCTLIHVNMVNDITIRLRHPYTKQTHFKIMNSSQQETWPNFAQALVQRYKCCIIPGTAPGPHWKGSPALQVIVQCSDDWGWAKWSQSTIYRNKYFVVHSMLSVQTTTLETGTEFLRLSTRLNSFVFFTYIYL